MGKYILLIFPLVTLAACTSVNVKPVDNVSSIKHVCVQECPDDCFVEDMPEVIVEGLERNGISAERFIGKMPEDCEYHLKYTCNVTWDMAMYMHHAEIRLLQGRKQIGSAVYHLTGQGGLSLMKWQGTRAKIDPVIDELFGKKAAGSN